MASTAELQLLISARDRAGKVLRDLQKRIGGTVKSLNQPIGGSSFAALIGIGAAGATVSGLARAGFQFNILKENAEIAFETLLGSADEAKKHIAELTAFAEKTPFRFPDLIRTSQRMHAFGFETEKVIPNLRIIGDHVASMGAGGEMIDRITLAFGQMKAKGKVQSQEMLQLTEANVQAWKFLAEGMGVSQAKAMKEVERGRVPAGKAIDFILEGMKKAEGQMERQSNTFAGALSNIQDVSEEILGGILRPIFVRLRDVLKFTAFQLMRVRVEFAKLPGPVKEAAAWAATFSMAIIPAAIGLVVIGNAIQWLRRGLRGFWPLIQSGVKIFKGMATLIWGALIVGLARLPGIFLQAGRALIGFVIRLIPLAGRILLRFLGPIGLLITAVWLLWDAWETNFLGIQGAVKAAWKPVKGFLQSLGDLIKKGKRDIELIINATIEWVGDIATTVGGWLAGTAGDLGRTISAGVSWAAGVAASIGGWLAGTAGDLGRTISAGVSWAAGVAASIGSWLAGTAGGIISRTISTAVSWWGDIATSIGSWLVGTAGGIISRTISVTASWFNATSTAIWDSVKNAAGTVTRTISVTASWFNATSTAIWDSVKNAAGAVTRNISVAASWFSGEAIWDSVKTAVTETVTKTMKVVGEWGVGVSEAVVNAWAWATTVASNVIDAILTVTASWGTTVSEAVANAWSWIVSAASQVIDAALTLAGSYRDGVALGVITTWNNIMHAAATIERTLKIGISFVSTAMQRFWEWLSGILFGTNLVATVRILSEGAQGFVPSGTAIGVTNAEQRRAALAGTGGGGDTYAVGPINITGSVLTDRDLEDVVVAALERARRRGRVSAT